MVRGPARASPQGAGWSRRGWLCWSPLVACPKSRVGPEHRFLGRAFRLAEVRQLLWRGELRGELRGPLTLGERGRWLWRAGWWLCAGRWLSAEWSASMEAALRTVPLPLPATCVLLLAGWRAAGRVPPPHRVLSFGSAPGVREAPALREQAEERLSPGREVWQMLLPSAGSGRLCPTTCGSA